MRVLTKCSRSEFIDQYIVGELGYKIVKKALVGKVCYMAVKENGKVTAHMAELNKSGDYIYYSFFHETELPAFQECPLPVFKALDGPESMNERYSAQEIENIKKWREKVAWSLYENELKKHMKYNDFFETLTPVRFDNGKCIKTFQKAKYKQKGCAYFEAERKGMVYQAINKKVAYQFNLDISQIESINGVSIRIIDKAVRLKIFDKESNYSSYGQLRIAM